MSKNKENFEDDRKLNKEQIDALRLEIEGISPKEREEVLKIARRLNEHILETHTDYIDHSKGPEEFPERLIFTKSIDAIGHFESIWLDYEKKGKDLGGVTIDPDKFSFLLLKNKKSSLAIKEYIQENKEECLEHFGSLEKAEEELLGAYRNNVITHELLHLYNSSLASPSIFSEAGAYFYTYQLMKGLFVSLNALNDPKLRSLYQELIDKYGDDVHKLFFGQEVDEEIRNSIFTEVQEEKFEELLQ